MPFCKTSNPWGDDLWGQRSNVIFLMALKRTALPGRLAMAVSTTFGSSFVNAWAAHVCCFNARSLAAANRQQSNALNYLLCPICILSIQHVLSQHVQRSYGPWKHGKFLHGSLGVTAWRDLNILRLTKIKVVNYHHVRFRIFIYRRVDVARRTNSSAIGENGPRNRTCSLSGDILYVSHRVTKKTK